MTHKHLTYRPDIDGLRAVAVLLVVVFHVWGSKYIPGGFIGVDIFFVISGFLITQIIHKELKQKTFTFKDFYTRRIRRLMPAFILVIVSTNVIALYILLPEDLIEYSKSQISAALFLSNMYLWSQAGGYFASNADFIPLLHTWSLSVEEQFYLIWPLCLLLLVKYFNFFIRIGIIIMITCLGFFLSEWAVNYYLSASYYFFPTRAFELLMGAILALSISRLPILSVRVSNLLSLIGLALIIIPSFILTKGSHFPGINALWPCLGAVLIIYSGMGENRGVTSRLLSLKPLVIIGLISYPLYLWHWPIISFTNYHAIEINFFEGSIIIILSLFLSFLTWKFIEKPVRDHVKFSFKHVFLWLFLLPSTVIILTSFLTIYSEGFPKRFSDEITSKNKAVMSLTHKIRGGCNQGDVENPLGPNECILGNASRNNIDILLIGDSHANAISGMIDVMASDAGLRGYDVTQSNTYPLVGVDVSKIVNGERSFYHKFRKRNDWIYEHIKGQNYQFVVIAGEYNTFFAEGGRFLTNEKYSKPSHENSVKLFEISLVQMIENIIATGATPVLIEDVPNMSEDLSRCSLNNVLYNKQQECSNAYIDIERKQQYAIKIFRKLEKNYPEIIVINPKLITCDSDRCFADIDGTPLYRDEGHLNDFGARLIGELYLEKIGNPFKDIQQGIGISE